MGPGCSLGNGVVTMQSDMGYAMEKYAGIHRSIMVPIVASALLLATVFVAGTWLQTRRQIHRKIDKQVAAVQNLFQTETDEDAMMLHALTDLLERDERIQHAWLAARPRCTAGSDVARVRTATPQVPSHAFLLPRSGREMLPAGSSAGPMGRSHHAFHAFGGGPAGSAHGWGRAGAAGHAHSAYRPSLGNRGTVRRIRRDSAGRSAISCEG